MAAHSTGRAIPKPDGQSAQHRSCSERDGTADVPAVPLASRCSLRHLLARGLVWRGLRLRGRRGGIGCGFFAWTSNGTSQEVRLVRRSKSLTPAGCGHRWLCLGNGQFDRRWDDRRRHIRNGWRYVFAQAAISCRPRLVAARLVAPYIRRTGLRSTDFHAAMLRGTMLAAAPVDRTFRPLLMTLRPFRTPALVGSPLVASAGVPLPVAAVMAFAAIAPVLPITPVEALAPIVSFEAVALTPVLALAPVLHAIPAPVLPVAAALVLPMAIIPIPEPAMLLLLVLRPALVCSRLVVAWALLLREARDHRLVAVPKIVAAGAVAVGTFLAFHTVGAQARRAAIARIVVRQALLLAIREDDAIIMLGVLQIILGQNRITRGLGVPCERNVFLRDVGGRAPHFHVGPIRFEAADQRVLAFAMVIVPVAMVAMSVAVAATAASVLLSLPHGLPFSSVMPFGCILIPHSL